MIKVKATAEGLAGKSTASGYVIDHYVSFVALPCKAALHKHVRVRNPLNDRSIMAEVLDVGPWNVDDYGYVFRGERPQSETGTDLFGRKTNSAGIDLGYRVWAILGMQDNTDIEWEFID